MIPACPLLRTAAYQRRRAADRHRHTSRRSQEFLTRLREIHIDSRIHDRRRCTADRRTHITGAGCHARAPGCGHFPGHAHTACHARIPGHTHTACHARAPGHAHILSGRHITGHAHAPGRIHIPGRTAFIRFCQGLCPGFTFIRPCIRAASIRRPAS